MEHKHASTAVSKAQENSMPSNDQTRKILLNLSAAQNQSEGLFRVKIATHADMGKLSIIKATSTFIISGNKSEIEKLEKLEFIAPHIEKPLAFLIVRGVFADLEPEQVLSDFKGLMPSVKYVKRINREGVPIPVMLVCLQDVAEADQIVARGHVFYLGRKCRVEKARSRPSHCFKCLRAGHFARDCRSSLVCSRCLCEGHKQHECKSDVQCTNCGEQHDMRSVICKRLRMQPPVKPPVKPPQPQQAENQPAMKPQEQKEKPLWAAVVSNSPASSPASPSMSQVQVQVPSPSDHSDPEPTLQQALDLMMSLLKQLQVLAQQIKLLKQQRTQSQSASTPHVQVQHAAAANTEVFQAAPESSRKKKRKNKKKKPAAPPAADQEEEPRSPNPDLDCPMCGDCEFDYLEDEHGVFVCKCQQ